MTDSKGVEPIFYGILEGICFLLFFLSPLLWQWNRIDWWLSLVVCRALALGIVFLPSRLADGRGERCVYDALLYQIPFWFSALAFPLQEWQSGFALVGLALQMVLAIALLFLRRHFLWFTAEAWLYIACLAWVGCYRPPDLWLALALLGFGFTIRRSPKTYPGYQQLSPIQGVAVAAVWLVAVALTSMVSGLYIPLRTYLILGCLWILAVDSLFKLRLLGERRIEAETALPNSFEARIWLNAKLSLFAMVGWLASFFVLIDALPGAGAALMWCLAWARGVALISRRRLSTASYLWWVSLELSFIWAALFWTASIPGMILSSVALLLLNRIGHRIEPLDKIGAGFSKLKRRLEAELPIEAPAGFAQKIALEIKASRLDGDLSSYAPSGFSQRLLKRLRKDEEG